MFVLATAGSRSGEGVKIFASLKSFTRASMLRSRQ